MPLPSLLWSGLTALAAFGIVIGIGAWWIIRLQNKKLSLPIVHIFDLPKIKLRPIRFVPPPFIPFICFSLLGLFMVFFTLKPSYLKQNVSSEKSSRVHIFADFSPSVSRFISTDSYISRIENLLIKLLPNSKVTLSSSHQDRVFAIKNIDEGKEVLAAWMALGFHRSGSNIAHALKKHLAQLDEAGQLIIMSDSDEHSLAGLNWQTLKTSMTLVYVDLSQIKSAETNLYIKKVQYLSSPLAKTIDWQVEIARSHLGSRAVGQLEVFLNDLKLASVNWEIPENNFSSTIMVAWPAQLLKMTDLQHKNLLWQIKTDSANSIAADDTFRTPVRGQKAQATIVSDIYGEQSLDDPASSLKLALEVLGLTVRRYDQIEGPQIHPDLNGLQIYFIDEQANLGQQCPGRNEGKNDDLNIWLVPSRPDLGHKNLCACFYYLAEKQANKDVSSACEGATDFKTLQTLMFASGFTQVGGSIGSGSKEAIAWALRKETTQVLLFTVPLRPDRALGITHARLPLLVGELLKAQSPGYVGQGVEDWPRISDNSEMLFWSKDNQAKDFSYQRYLLSNVPEAESLARDGAQEIVSANVMAHNLSDSAIVDSLGAELSKSSEPYLHLGLGMVILMCLFEVLAYALLHLRRRAGANIIAAMAALLLFFLPQRVEAISLVSLGSNALAPDVITSLASEVNSRTSLTLDKKAISYPAISDDILSQPWIWTQGLAGVRQSSGKLNENLVRWLKRGGFLVIEDSVDQQGLEALTSEHFQNEYEKGQWQTVPVGHELLKSFYLLDALPECKLKPWYGFIYDKRLAVLTIPFKFFDALKGPISGCGQIEQEQLVRIYVNILMVALTTDYKNDQIHVNAILKRLQ